MSNERHRAELNGASYERVDGCTPLASARQDTSSERVVAQSSSLGTVALIAGEPSELDAGADADAAPAPSATMDASLPTGNDGG